MHLAYDEMLRVWEEADELPELDDAWLWDHLIPLAGPPGGAVLEGWTLLAALAARTTRLRLGLLVTSNRLRTPAHLGKIATTVDVISKGRLITGLGVGGTRQLDGPNPAVAEYAAYGLPLLSPGEGLARLNETITILRRMWTEEAFDHDGPFTTLRGTTSDARPARPSDERGRRPAWSRGRRGIDVVGETSDGAKANPVRTSSWSSAIMTRGPSWPVEGALRWSGTPRGHRGPGCSPARSPPSPQRMRTAVFWPSRPGSALVAA